MLVTLKEILKIAEEKNIAVGGDECSRGSTAPSDYPVCTGS